MAHELGHYYSEANDPDKYDNDEWENAADHYAIGLLHDLTSTNDALAKLLVRFREVFMGEIYNAIPENNRSSLEPGFNLYEHLYFLPGPSAFKEYASMQLVRERILLDNPALTTRTCRDILHAGMESVATSDKVKLYHGQMGTHYFPVYDKAIGNDQEAALSKTMGVSYGKPEMGCFDNGEVYSVVVKDSILTLSILTPTLRTKAYDLTSISDQLDSLAGQKVVMDDIPGSVVFHFNNEESLNIYSVVAAQDTTHFSIVTCVISLLSTPKIVSSKTEKLNYPSKGEKGLYYRSHNDQVVILDLFDYSLRTTYRLRMNVNIPCTAEKLVVTKKYENTPDADSLPPLKAKTFGLRTGVDPVGSELVKETYLLKYRTGGKQYSVSGNVNGIRVGTQLSMSLNSMIWSSKYGYLDYDSSKKCAFGIKF
jgi:hypothetical protein